MVSLHVGSACLDATLGHFHAFPDIKEAIMKSRVLMLIVVMTLMVLVLFAVLTIPAQASIHYTPVNTVIPNNRAYGVDFNHDGTKDFWIGSYFGPLRCGLLGGYEGSANVFPVQSTSGVILNSVFAAALPAGISVGPGKSFATGQPQLMFYNTCGGRLHFAGNWFDVTNHYLGMEFHISGQTYYGWVELSVSAGFRSLTTTVIGFAYESTPGKAIITGQTGIPGFCTIPSTDQTIHLCTPAAGGTAAASPVVISARARWDNQTITHMRIYIDNDDLYDQDNPPGDAIVVSVPLNAGSHHLVISAWDTHGNYIQSGENFDSK
jgi:hypothetical protein